jgi:hypothetical protein
MSNWNEEREAALEKAVGGKSPVSQETVATAAEELGVTPRSASAKLRKMGYEVEKVSARQKTFTEDEEDALVDFLDENSGTLTYAEIAEEFEDGKFSAKQIQGKVLSLELTDAVKATPKPVVEKKYNDKEEEKFIQLAKAGAYLEDIADALDRKLASIRGKALSLSRVGKLLEIPPQREKYGKVKVDPFEELGDEISKLTVEEISERIGKSERGVKVMLTRRGLDCANYKAKTKKKNNGA